MAPAPPRDASACRGAADEGSRWQRHERSILACGAALAILLRCIMALMPYSGQGNPPMYGDYEAQRHWMEITTALSVQEWYENSTDNDLMYWGLDYPPLTAYHSWLLGHAGHAVVPDCFKLYTSRGHESHACRAFMRASVIASDILVYMPGAVCAVRGLLRAAGDSGPGAAQTRIAMVMALWLLPPLLLIDHGHFQYNGVCFGLVLAAVGCVATDRTLIGSVFFTSALLFKQIALYFAPGFFFAILACCLRGCGDKLRLSCAGCGRVAMTGFVVLATAALLFAPWLTTPTPVRSAGQVIHRMFPFARGLYEDKVANVWCSISVIIKLNRLLPQRAVPPTCAAVTLFTLLPSCACCLRGPRSGAGPFVAALFASSLAFFLFAFQVHEKGILFPCVAATLLPLAVSSSRRPSWAWTLVVHFWTASLFSMYPLVVKDGLHVAYILLCVGLIAMCELLPATLVLRLALRAAFLLAFALHGIYALVPAPARYPDAWTLLITGSSCGYFVCCLVAVTFAQLKGLFDKQGPADAMRKDE
eukprot:TRINITY_DN2916_c0_g1_i2.p1 TRINITY_DN2916_c0_g1~~TRINITY_DN2916_c0_g1_i2.p1  ORF type:complete len:532 (-),score=90.67 TRINITY_DN2916_c0_g1_i2:349-1944(-)